MKGLFLVTLDHYSWDDLIAVSAVNDNLVAHHKGLEDGIPIYTKSESAKARDDAMKGVRTNKHYIIEDVLEV